MGRATTRIDQSGKSVEIREKSKRIEEAREVGKAARVAQAGKEGGETTVELSRAPFRGLLDRVMATAPSDEALQALAERAPDRWMRTMTELAKLAGFDPRLVERGRSRAGEVMVAEMSDAELQQLVKAMRAE